VRTSDAEGSLRLEVSDTGSGIETDKLDRIFDAFEQVVPKSSAGLGLGLAICKALVELHGGRIEAHSSGPATGASFLVTLPCFAQAKSERSTISGAPASLGAMRILIVDDHFDTVESLRLLLVQDGHEVRVAATVAQALKVAETFAFDVLISDIGLPDGSGTELLESLNRKMGRIVPAIAMSGFGMEHDRELSRTAGFAEHLTKPVEFGSLQKAILRIVGRRPRE
jgi:two-component system, chemotaxis family, CheB/CheR fusion protein